VILMPRPSKRRYPWWALPTLMLATLALPSVGHADPCVDSQSPPPNCQTQTTAPVYYSFWDSKTWAYYCTGDHPYYWGINTDGNKSDVIGYEIVPYGFTTVESEFDENTPSKLDAFFTNWSTGQNLVVQIACSNVPPPQAKVCDTTGSPVVGDPGCMQSQARQYCSGGPTPVCFTLFLETCNNQQTYQCTEISILPAYCQACTG
jgi:hypothetical protein